MKKFFGWIVLLSAMTLAQCTKDPAPPALPEVGTLQANNITSRSATAGGIVSSDGGDRVTIRGMVWATERQPTTDLQTQTANGTGVGTFTGTMRDLLPGTRYFVRAYATNSVGTAYGNEQSFITLVDFPELTTTLASAITSTSAMSGGNVTSEGGATVTSRGVCWSTTTSPTIAHSKTSDGTGSGYFASHLSGLSPATRYFVRAYAVNEKGITYGNQVNFTTAE